MTLLQKSEALNLLPASQSCPSANSPQRWSSCHFREATVDNKMGCIASSNALNKSLGRAIAGPSPACITDVISTKCQMDLEMGSKSLKRKSTQVGCSTYCNSLQLHRRRNRWRHGTYTDTLTFTPMCRAPNTSGNIRASQIPTNPLISKEASLHPPHCKTNRSYPNQQLP